MAGNLFKYTIFFLFYFSFVKISDGKDIAKPLIFQGRDLNPEAKSFIILNEGFIFTKYDTITLQDDGSFYIYLDTIGRQKISFLLDNKPVSFFGKPGDVINIFFNSKTGRIIKSSASNKKKSEILNFDLFFWSVIQFKRDSTFNTIVQTEKEDAIQYDMFKSFYYDLLLKLISNDYLSDKELSPYITDLYFSFASFMNGRQLYDIEKLSLVEDTVPQTIKKIALPSNFYDSVSENLLLLSPDYRYYLFDKFRLYSRRNSEDALLAAKFNNPKESAPWIEYSKSDSINNVFIKDWYEVRSIIYSLKRYSQSEAQKVANLFIAETGNINYKELIKNFKIGYNRFSKGKVAPDFNLTNEVGKKVSLSSLKGNIVYITFWDINCHPSVRALTTELPFLKNKYEKKKIIFLNIYLNEDEENWRNSLKKLRIPGVNLISNFEIGPYNIKSLPHYILIDEESRFIEYNANSPLLYIQSNKLESLLN